MHKKMKKKHAQDVNKFMMTMNNVLQKKKSVNKLDTLHQYATQKQQHSR